MLGSQLPRKGTEEKGCQQTPTANDFNVVSPSEDKRHERMERLWKDF